MKISVIHHENRIKGKNPVVTLVDTENTFDRIQHPFMIKTLNEPRREGDFHNLIKDIF